jgi:formate hydrogenlyase subunit 3/multisubunit Na+/H+ antiporter MnhD subunit
MLLPTRDQRYDGTRGLAGSTGAPPATTAETYEDLAGVGRKRLGLGLAMAVCCFSLIGLPLTIGFFGKLYLLQPVFRIGTSKMNWLGVITVVNAAIGAAYYLRIIATMFLRPEPETVRGFEPVVPGATPIGSATIAGAVRTYDAPAGATAASGVRTYDRPAAADAGYGRFSPVSLSIGLSVALTLLFGAIFPATNALSDRSINASHFDRTARVRPIASAADPAAPPTPPAAPALTRAGE